MSEKLRELRNYLESLPPGPVADDGPVGLLLADAWLDLDGGSDGGMEAFKVVGRMESASWQPPNLVFEIERHGATVNGSTRAEVQSWRVNVDAGTARLVAVGRRQLYKMTPRWDAREAVQAIAAAIREGLPDRRLRWASPGRVQLIAAEILPVGPKQSTEGRRRRLRAELLTLLEGEGWRPRGAWWVKGQP